MNKKDGQIIIVSGPLGIGKSSVAKAIGNRLKDSVVIEGDYFFLQTAGSTLIDWEERIQISWENILSSILVYKKHGLTNFIVDFVVENEKQWLFNKLSDYNLLVKYVVLYASKDTIRERLEKRGDKKYLKRSLKILDHVLNDKSNEEYLYDTEGRSIEMVANEIIQPNNYIFN